MGFSGKNTRADYHFSPQGDLPNPGMKGSPPLLCLQHCRRILYPWAKREALLYANWWLTFWHTYSWLCFIQFSSVQWLSPVRLFTAPWIAACAQEEKKQFKNGINIPKKGKETEVAQLCPTLWDPVDCSPPGSSVRGFSRQEYWSGLSFPSPNHFISIPFYLILTTLFEAYVVTHFKTLRKMEWIA